MMSYRNNYSLYVEKLFLELNLDIKSAIGEEAEATIGRHNEIMARAKAIMHSLFSEYNSQQIQENRKCGLWIFNCARKLPRR